MIYSENRCPLFGIMRWKTGAQERTRDLLSITEASVKVRAKPAPLTGTGNFQKRPPPPDPEKQRPGASGKATRANRKTSVGSQPKNSTRQPRIQAPERTLSLYDGRVRLATITSSGDQFVVILPSGVLLGSFDTLKQATAEASAALGGSR
jgi:hypothetical protein